MSKELRCARSFKSGTCLFEFDLEARPFFEERTEDEMERRVASFSGLAFWDDEADFAFGFDAVEDDVDGRPPV